MEQPSSCHSHRSAMLRNKEDLLAESSINTFTVIATPMAMLNRTSKPSLKKFTVHAN